MVDSNPFNSNLNYKFWSLDKFNKLISISQVICRRIGKIELLDT